MVVEALTKENFQEEIEECANKKDWKKIIKLAHKYGFEISSLLYWVFPSEYCLEQLKVNLKSFSISSILSIGCGNGLLEFLINQSIGVKINGLEIDQKYWSRKRKFISMHYIDGRSVNSQILLDANASKNWNFALLFCYFNLRPVFDAYIEAYKGNFVIIIGPQANTNRYTDPLPLDFQDNDDFHLAHLCEFGDNRDLLAVYERKIKSHAV